MISEKYYEILGVSRNSTENDIKIAYKQLAKKYHPDLNKEPDAKERFIEIQKAYETIISLSSKTPSIFDVFEKAFSKENQEKWKKERERPKQMSEVFNNIIEDICQYCGGILDTYFTETDPKFKETFADWDDNFEELAELKEEIHKKSWQYNLEDDGCCCGEDKDCLWSEEMEEEERRKLCKKCFEKWKEDCNNSYKRSIDIGFAYIRAYLEATPKYYKPLRKEYNSKKVKTGSVKNWL